MSDRYQVFRWDRVRGECLTEPPASLPDYLAAELYDSELTGQQALLKKRPVTTAISLTSGPTAHVQMLFNFVTTSTDELWAFSRNTGAGVVAHRRVSGTWSSVSLPDTPAVDANPTCAVLNNKLFIAYASAANRLHLWDGVSVRRVGVVASVAATVADTGAGTYAATLRYYKIQFKIKSGSDTIATSELSASVSFTPSGTGTAARVTKPTTSDSATHWRVFGSEDDVTYYTLGSADIAVGTTTYDDSAAPSTYSDGVVAPTAGLSVPPPSVRFLTTDGNRLLMASGASASGFPVQTDPRFLSRVWFTAVLGARDQTGEDESIPQTLDQKNWIDVGEGDGDIIRGLSAPIAGLLYVFKTRSIWMLIPTGSPVTPYRAEKVMDGVGVNGAYAIDTGEIGLGQPAVYFMGATGGPYRISPTRGLEWLGKDWWTLPESDAAFGVRWWPTRRQIWCMDTTSVARVLTPDLVEQDGPYLRGGWSRYRVSIGTGGTSVSTFRASAIVSNQVFLGGAISDTTAAIVSLGSGTQDAGTSDVTPTVTSKAYLLAQQGRKKLSAENPIVETYQDQTTTVGYIVDYGTARSGSYSDQGGSGRTTQKIEDVWAVDGRALQIQVTLTDAADADAVEAVTVPFKEAEPL